MNLRRTLRAAALIVALTSSACAANGSAGVETNRVDMPRSYLFSPKDIHVKAGTTVTWTNSDQFTHSVRLAATGEVLGILKPGDSLTHVFSAPGVYAYECSFHPQNMKGTVTVTAP